MTSENLNESVPSEPVSDTSPSQLPRAQRKATSSPVLRVMRAHELWIPASIALFVSMRWLLGERHSLYGDEHFHLTALLNGIANAAHGTLLNCFVNLYLFNFAYPPVFHLLGAPFVLSSADPVFGGRIYAQILQLLVALTLYSVTRRVAGKLAATVAVITLLGSPSFVDPSRHYLLETLLTLEVLLLLYLIDRYYDASRLSDLILMGFVISAGLLTKFNFFFYAVWLFIVPAMVECYRVIRARQPISNAMLFVAIVMVGPLVIAGPWYISRATGTTSPLGLLAQQFDAGLSTIGWDIGLS
jgi:dolichyl-phosphate-mannose--protein O-mannosyl transferase